jgi:copper(I)-binding protein
MVFGAAAFATETFAQGPSSFGSIVVTPTGVRATFGLGTVTVTGNSYIEDVPGVRATFAVGALSVTGDANFTLVGVRSTFSTGDVTIESKYDVTGVRATFALGSVVVTGTANVTLEGVRATFATGVPKLTIWNGVPDANTDIWTIVPTG